MTTAAVAETEIATAAAASPQAGPIEYVKTVGLTTNQSGRGFTNPYDTAATDDGRILVLNRCDTARASLVRIGILNWAEDYLGEFSRGYGRGDGQWILPVAIALDRRRQVYVTDEQQHRITVLDLDGNFIRQWGERGSAPGQLDAPAGIVISPDDTVYVAEQGNHRVQRFSADGRSLGMWGEAGSAAGQFNMPWGIGLDTAGNVYVADWRNDRIQKFTPDGGFIAAIGSSGSGDGQLSRPAGVCVDSGGFIYVADWGNERVQVFDAAGQFVQSLRGQATLSKWAQDFMSVNPDERNTREISNLIPELPAHFDTPYLISSQTEPYFWGPVSVRLDAAERLLVTESNRHRVQIYQRSQQ